MPTFIRDFDKSLMAQFNELKASNVNLDQTFSIIDNKNKYQSTLLFYAIAKDDNEAVQMLLDSGVDAAQQCYWMWAKKKALDEIATMLPAVFNESSLIALAKKLGYEIKSKGICLGFAHMAKQAILCGEVDKFNQRLIYLFDVYNQTELEALNELSLKPFMYFNDDQRKLIDFLLQKKTNKFFAELKIADTKKYNDVLAFLDGIVLHQCQPKYYSENKYETCTDAYAQQVTRLLNQEVIEYRGGFVRSYHKEALQDFITNLEIEIKRADIKKPISFILLSTNHAITIGYDASTQQWLFANSKSMPMMYVNASDKLVDKIFKAFKKKNDVVLSASIYANKADNNAVEKLLFALRFYNNTSQKKQWRTNAFANAASFFQSYLMSKHCVHEDDHKTVLYQHLK